MTSFDFETLNNSLILHPERVPDFFTNVFGMLDTRHINEATHVGLGDMAILYLREQLCLIERGEQFPEATKAQLRHSDLWPSDDITYAIPRLAMQDQWSEVAVQTPGSPRCRSIISPVDPLTPLQNEGWFNSTKNDKVAWEAMHDGAQITFEFSTLKGALGMWIWGTGEPNFGSVECWLDTDKTPQQVFRRNTYTEGRTVPMFDWTGEIWSQIVPGKHTITCRSIANPGTGGATVRISALIFK